MPTQRCRATVRGRGNCAAWLTQINSIKLCPPQITSRGDGIPPIPRKPLLEPRLPPKPGFPPDPGQAKLRVRTVIAGFRLTAATLALVGVSLNACPSTDCTIAAKLSAPRRKSTGRVAISTRTPAGGAPERARGDHLMAFNRQHLAQKAKLDPNSLIQINRNSASGFKYVAHCAAFQRRLVLSNEKRIILERRSGRVAPRFPIRHPKRSYP